MKPHTFVLIALIAGLFSLTATADDNWKDKRWKGKELKAGDLDDKDFDEGEEEDFDDEEDQEDDFDDEEDFEGEDEDFKEEQVSPKSLPSAVKKQVAKQFKKFRVEEATKVTEGDEVYYLISLDTSKGEAEIGISPEGAPLFVEMAISPRDLPSAVKKAAKEEFGRVRVIETYVLKEFNDEEADEDPETVYSIEMIKDRKEIFVSYSKDGERLEEEEDDFEDEEEFEDGDDFEEGGEDGDFEEDDDEEEDE